MPPGTSKVGGSAAGAAVRWASQRRLPPTAMTGALRWLLAAATVRAAAAVACRELFADFKEHCECTRDDVLNGTAIHCDGRSFFGTFVVLPYRQNIVRYSQSHAGLQDLESQLFTASDIPLRHLDFSSNLLRRITDKVFDGIEDTLEHLELSNNILGDQLNPVFGPEGFNKLNNLKYLGLRNNLIKSIGDNTFRGLTSLRGLDLSQNELTQVPLGSLKHLEAVREIDLSKNRLKSVENFPRLQNLIHLNLSDNKIATIGETGFSHLPSLESLDLSFNYIKKDINISGLVGLRTLNMSYNLFQEVPASIQKLASLQWLDISRAKIRNLGYSPFLHLTRLEYLNLAWNEIVQVQPNTFEGLVRLKALILDANIIRKFEESHISDLENLLELSLKDNQLLSFPTEIFLKLKKLSILRLDYNRIAAVSEELLRYATKLNQLSLNYNLLNEIPEGTFRDMSQLKVLQLRGNNLKKFTPSSYNGLETSLVELDIADNQISYMPMLNLTALEVLDVSGNQLVNLQAKMFSATRNLKKLVLAKNHFSKIDASWVEPLTNLEHLDISNCQISIIYDNSLKNYLRAKHLNLANNGLEAFGRNINIETVEELDLSGNYLSDVKLNVKRLRTLNLSYNRLREFNISSNSPFALRQIDVSYNRIQELRDDLFGIHLSLADVNLSHNMLTQLTGDVLRSFPNVEILNLAGNQLHVLRNKTFSPLQNLAFLDISHNQVHTLEGTPFINCSSLNSIDLSFNLLEELTDECFHGISRLRLNLKANQLHALPQNTFSRTNVFALEAIDLAENLFYEFPETSLRRQYSVIDKANFSMNHIRSIPSNADVLVNVKHIDISHNPLTSDAHYVLLGEPKSLRTLHMSNVSLRSVPDLETPFLRELVAADNYVTGLAKTTFKRTTGLIKLDLAGNRLGSFSGNSLALSRLEHLDLSGNQLLEITKKSFAALPELTSLRLSGLSNLTKIDCNAFASQKQLNELEVLGFPRVKELNLSCIGIPNSLETLMIEVKTPSLSSHLHMAFNPRLKKLLVAGDTLEQLTPTTLAGIRSEFLDLVFYNTNLRKLPASLFLPLPLSSSIRLSAEYSQITYLDSNLVQLLNSRPGFIVSSFEGSPLHCNCNATDLYNALTSRPERFSEPATIRCYTPLILRSIPLANLQPNQLRCESEEDANHNSYEPANNFIGNSDAHEDDRSNRDIRNSSFNVDSTISGEHRQQRQRQQPQELPPLKLDESFFRDRRPYYRSSPTLAQDLVVRKTIIAEPPFLTKVDMLIIVIISAIVLVVTTLSVGICICKWYGRTSDDPPYVVGNGVAQGGAWPPPGLLVPPPHVALPLPSKCTCVRPPSAPCTCRTSATSTRGRTPDDLYPQHRGLAPMLVPPLHQMPPAHPYSRPASMWGDGQSWR